MTPAPDPAELPSYSGPAARRSFRRIKLALFPLHIWLPNAYTYAPAIVTAFLAATATKVAYYVLVRFAFSVFRVNLTFETSHHDAILMALGLAAMLAGSLVAIYQDDLKRMLAYSSVAQIGYMVLGLSLANEHGLTGGLVHVFNHALMKCGLFLVQIGQFSLKPFMIDGCAGNIPRAARPCACGVNRFVHGGQNRRMLAHAQIIIAAPHRHRRL